MKKKALLIAALSILFFSGCEVQATFDQSENKAPDLTAEEIAILHSELLSLSELFDDLDDFESFSFTRYKLDRSELARLVVRVRFSQDVYLGVNSFEIDGTNVKELKLKTKQLLEEVKDAQDRPGS